MPEEGDSAFPFEFRIGKGYRHETLHKYRKVGLPPSKKVIIVSLSESTLKMMRILFISCCKLFSFLRYFFLTLKNGLIRKPTLISKFMTSQAGQQIITIHILSNILTSKGNQTMAFGQLIEYNTINIFLEKSYRKCGGEVSPRPFYKKSKLDLSLDQQSEMP